MQVQLFLAACRALAMEVRYVCPLVPVAVAGPRAKRREKGGPAVVDVAEHDGADVGSSVWVEVSLKLKLQHRSISVRLLAQAVFWIVS
jgi:hypothetical protein